MARTPKPWYRARRRAWFVMLDGKQRLLVRGPKNHETRKVAGKALRALLVIRDEGRKSESAPMLVGELAVAYLADLQGRQDRGELSRYAVPDFHRRTAGFVEQLGNIPITDLTPHLVMKWLNARGAEAAKHKQGPKSFGPTARNDAIGAVKTMTRWARKRRIITADPLDGMDKPARNPRRELVIDARKIPAVLDAMEPGPFRDLMRFLHWTGCRPSEAAGLEARHLDLERGIAVLPEHKTKKKTQRPRVLILPPAAVDLVRDLATVNPVGPLFRNARGNAWTKDAVNCAIRRLRRSTGLGRELIAYGMRHGFVTDLLASGASDSVAAEVAGHADTRMIRTYSHLSERTELLADAVAAVRGARPDTQGNGSRGNM